MGLVTPSQVRTPSAKMQTLLPFLVARMISITVEAAIDPL